MCGFTGFWDFKGKTENPSRIAEAMVDKIKHRGPDSQAVWRDPKEPLFLAHARLSIRDLSAEGAQPMVSASGRWVIVYNGEIYNADELKQSLQTSGKSFKGHSDTEVLLEACDTWGPENAIRQIIGMFAFALWDREEYCLYLCRDRLGIKPLYWGMQNGHLFFGSQLKSFFAHPHFEKKLNCAVLPTYFYLNYVPRDTCIFESVHKLEPGVLLKIKGAEQEQSTFIRYWDFKDIFFQDRMALSSKADQEWLNDLEFLLKDAVKRRMVADVPLGAFLSGGIDSSLVVALMQSQSNRSVKSFSIGFTEPGYNEADHAKAVAQHLGTDHQEWYVASSEALKVIPQIPEWFDEPFADVSQIPTYLVSKLARQEVIVSLSGDGGDELFAGYNRYHLGHQIWASISRLPLSVRKGFAFLLETLSASSLNRFSHWSRGYLPPMLGDKVHKLASVLKLPNKTAFYETLISFWDDPVALGAGFKTAGLVAWREKCQILTKHPDFVEVMQGLDTITYLPDDILTKVDRASMAVGLEARVPLLDHRVVSLAWQMPSHLKIRQGQNKWALRQILARYVPRKLIDRPKMGFGVPIDHWLRGVLREWAETLLCETALKDAGLNPIPIRQRWSEHLSGKRAWQYSLWGILMYQQWRAQYL